MTRHMLRCSARTRAQTAADREQSRQKESWSFPSGASALFPAFAGTERILSHAIQRSRRALRHLRFVMHAVLLQHDDLGADLYSVEQVDDVGIAEPDAAGRHVLADRARRIGAVNAIFRAADVERARAEWIAWAAGHHPWQVRLASYNFPRGGAIPPLP